MYANVLVTTDGSPFAEAAFTHAAHVVGPEGRVTVVAVIDTIGHVLARTSPAGFELTGAGMLDADIAETIIGSQREGAERNLASARAVLEGAGIHNVETVLTQGRPGDRIIEIASERGCDIVVMSFSEHPGILRMVPGSVTAHVLQHLDGIPLLLIHLANNR